MRARAQLFVMLMIVAVGLAACSHGKQAGSGKANQQKSGILMGEIAGGAATPSMAGAEIKIVKPDGALAATARIDGHGRYRLILPAGQYRVERGAGFAGTAGNLPARIAVSPGGKTRLDVWVEPGKS